MNRPAREPRPTPPPARLTATLLVAALAALLPAAGCADSTADPSPRPEDRSPGATVVTPAPSKWRSVDGSPQVVVSANESVPGLAAAMTRARDTAEAARERWRASSPEQRGRWSVSWAAPTVVGGVEYLWVEPINWSAFRIEGRLANPPRQELASGRGLGEVVGFPIEELADWMYAGASGREGGFTLDVLEDVYGEAAPPTETAAP